MEIDKYNGQYIVDYCQLIHNGIAYLPIHYREYENQAFSAGNNPHHYSFILTVPVELSKAPFLPRLLPYMANHDIVHIAASGCLSISTKQLAQVSACQNSIEEPQLGWKQRLFKIFYHT